MRMILLALALAACAASPDKIPPVAMSSSAYANGSCATVNAERNSAAIQLASLTQAQTDARFEDTVNVILWGLPTATLNGKDREPEIAALKGQIAAMDARLANCG